MRIVIAADDIYAIHAGVLLASLREHAPEAETVLLHTGMSPENLAKLAVSEAVMIPGGQLAGLPARGHITRTAYLRLLAADVLPDDRVLYLDTDTVAASSLSPLLEAEYSDDFYLRRRGSRRRLQGKNRNGRKNAVFQFRRYGDES